jgi:hypothetical protein
VLTGQTQRRMNELSEELITGLAHTAPCDDVEGIFDGLGRVVSEMRGRPVILKTTHFPPHTASGLWLDLPDMDIVAVREDAADSQHALVIAGHEIWHMFEGHCSAHTSVGPAAARAQSAPRAEAVEYVVNLLLASADDRLSDLDQRGLKYAARTNFTEQHEAEAELFGLQFATDLRELRRSRRRLNRDELAGRIADSLGRGLWA